MGQLLFQFRAGFGDLTGNADAEVDLSRIRVTVVYASGQLASSHEF